MTKDKYIKVRQPFYSDTYISHFKCLICGYKSESWLANTKYFVPEDAEEEIKNHIQLAHKG